MTDEELAEIRARHEDDCMEIADMNGPERETHADRSALLAEVDRLRAERDVIMREWAIETDESLTECVVRNIDGWRQRAEKAEADAAALRSAAREYLETLGGAMKTGKFQMGGSAEMAHFVRQAMQKLDSLVFDREGPRPAGLENLHEPIKGAS